jgi:cell division protein FtsI/penicillin-binding protein 2
MDSKKIFLTRIRIIAFVTMVIGAFFLYRLFTLQIIRTESYKETADRSYMKSADTFDRGTIFFEQKDGTRISAATVNSGFILSINPTQIKDIQETINTLSGVVVFDHDTFMMKAKKKNDPYEEIRGKLTRDEADAITALHIPGVYLYKQKWRFYPGETLAAQTIGFLGFGSGDTLSGQYGLEKFYDSMLVKHEENLYVNIFAEIFSDIKHTVSNDDTNKDGDIVTTIEPTVQNFLEGELADVVEKYHPTSANGIVIDPQTGEMIAIAHIPTFNLNEFQNVDNASLYSNPVVENSYEFGSVVKPLVMAAGIDTGVISASTPFNDKGSVVVGDRTIYNFDKKARGQTDLQQVLSQSLNTGMVFVEQKIGKVNFKKYMLAYKLGDKTGIDLPNEAKGLIGNLLSGRDVENANISFGQGISFTPITLVRALSSLGNGGYLIQPHVVKEIDYSDGSKKTISYDKLQQPKVLKDETSTAISKMLVYSVDNVYGQGKYKMPNYSIAAKTGTAQIPDLKNGGYFEDRNLHSFVGYFPAFNPKFLVFLSITAPQGVRYAAETLSQPFFDITHFLINYYEIPPDR